MDNNKIYIYNDAIGVLNPKRHKSKHCLFCGHNHYTQETIWVCSLCGKKRIYIFNHHYVHLKMKNLICKCGGYFRKVADSRYYFLCLKCFSVYGAFCSVHQRIAWINLDGKILCELCDK